MNNAQKVCVLAAIVIGFLGFAAMTVIPHTFDGLNCGTVLFPKTDELEQQRLDAIRTRNEARGPLSDEAFDSTGRRMADDLGDMADEVVRLLERAKDGCAESNNSRLTMSSVAVVLALVVGVGGRRLFADET